MSVGLKEAVTVLLSRNKIRVLAADDSAVMRDIFGALFASREAAAAQEPDAPFRLPAMELCGVARDGVECLDAIARLRPDVLLLDLEMPRMNGLQVLERLRGQAPQLPTIICSSYSERGAKTTLDALAAGAADYVTKPARQTNARDAMQVLARQLLPKIAVLADRAVSRGARRFETSANARMSQPESARQQLEDSVQSGVKVVAIGISTGGPSALERMLPRLPAGFPVPVLIVQHMPKLFTGALAHRLDRCCALRVQEAYDGASVQPGTIWIAPGDAHLEVAPVPRGKGTILRLVPGTAEDHYTPAADNLFCSLAHHYGGGCLAVVMTGMGSDGLAGSCAIRDAGGTVLIQDQQSSAVWGMPGRVAEAGIAAATLPLEEIAADLLRRTLPMRPINLQKATPGTWHKEAHHGVL